MTCHDNVYHPLGPNIRDLLSTPVSSLGLLDPCHHVKILSLTEHCTLYSFSLLYLVHTTIGCGEQGFPSAQPYLGHILNAVNNQRALGLKLASVSVLG
jgi:hypothetical protein